MKLATLVKVCTAFALLAGLTQQAGAATISGGYNISGPGFSCKASDQGSGSLSDSSPECSSYITSGSFSVSGSGSATYDTLRATASAGLSDLDPSGAYGSGSLLASATGSAQYSDSITIDIAGRTGDYVDLVFTTEMNGNAAATADSSTYASVDATLRVIVNGYRVNVSRSTGSEGDPVFNDLNPGVVQIQLGSAFSVSSLLQVTARIQALTAINGMYNGDAFANFGNSAGITSFELFEAGSNVAIDNWDLTSESGAFGFYNAAAVPVPASIWLFGSGLLGLIGMARRKKAA